MRILLKPCSARHLLIEICSLICPRPSVHGSQFGRMFLVNLVIYHGSSFEVQGDSIEHIPCVTVWHLEDWVVSSLTCEVLVVLELREQVAPRFNACLSEMKPLENGWGEQAKTLQTCPVKLHTMCRCRAVGPRGKLQSRLGPLYREGSPAVKCGTGVSIWASLPSGDLGAVL